MNYKHYIGIDVSKNTLDIELINSFGEVLQQKRISNSTEGVRKLFHSWSSNKLFAPAASLICMEPTGHYSNVPMATLLNLGLSVWMANPVDIRNSIGMQRGKNDSIDAHRIAMYALRFKDKARLVTPEDITRHQLQQLLTQRDLLIRDKAKYMGQISDFKGRLDNDIYQVIARNNKAIIDQLQKSIAEIDHKLEVMISKLPAMKEQCELLKTIPGVGTVISQTLVILTNGFTRFDNPRTLACHAGVAPFEYNSGTSVKTRNRVSYKANKRLKYLLHMAAMSSIRCKGDIQNYYNRKVAEGKNKMSVINAVRNKILHRACAVIKRKSAYSLELP